MTISKDHEHNNHAGMCAIYSLAFKQLLHIFAANKWTVSWSY